MDLLLILNIFQTFEHVVASWITKNLNWKILTKVLTKILKGGVGLRMKSFKIMWFTEKSDFRGPNLPRGPSLK